MRGSRRSGSIVLTGLVSVLVIGSGLATHSAPSRSVTRYVGPLSIGSGGPSVRQVVLSVSNLNSTPVKPKVQIVDQNGEVQEEMRPTIEPGETASVSSLMEEEGIFYFFGRIKSPRDVASGLPSAIRAVDGTNGPAYANVLRNSPVVFDAKGCLSGPLMHLGDGQSLTVLASNLSAESASLDIALRGVDRAVASTLEIPSIPEGHTEVATFTAEVPTDVRPVVTAIAGTKALISLELTSDVSPVIVSWPFGAAQGGSFVFRNCTDPTG